MYITTPLAVLPNDAIYFYMNPVEYNKIKDLNTFCRILQCSVSVVPQGLRTAFDTGTTLTGTATSEHCAIGITAVGINQKIYTRAMRYVAAAESPMLPTECVTVSNEEIITKYYGDDEYKTMPMILGVPRHVDMYCSLTLNSKRAVTGYVKHDEGVPILDKHLDRFNFLPFVGKEVINWEYYPTNGIFSCKAHDVPFTANEQETVHSMNTGSHMSNKLTIRQSKDGVAQAYLTFNQENMSTSNKYAYNMSIDGTKIFAPYIDFGTYMKKVVPQIYMGKLVITVLWLLYIFF